MLTASFVTLASDVL